MPQQRSWATLALRLAVSQVVTSRCQPGALWTRLGLLGNCQAASPAPFTLPQGTVP